MTLATCALVAWMSSNRLRLNPSKTQYIWLGTRQQLAKLDLAAMALRFPHYSLLTYCSRLGTHTGSAAYLCSSHSPPMPRLLLPAASATCTCHPSLSHFHCYCYSCPRLCHISAWFLLHALRGSPCCASGLPRARYPRCRAPHRRHS